MAMTRIYDLAEDHELVARVQSATLNTTDFGIVPEVALYGSPAWWQAIDDGRIPKHVVEGVISDVFVSGESNWPQFEIDSHGTKSVWTRHGNPRLYEIGRHVKVTYVAQRPKKTWTGDTYQNEVLSIDAET